MSVVLIAATAVESSRLRSAPATLVVTGIGAVNTAHALTRQLMMGPRPALVIQLGIAGAYVPAGIPVGSVVLANEELYGDVGVLTPTGWCSAEAIGIPLVEASPLHPVRFNRFPLDPALVAAAEAVCGTQLFQTGRFLTLSQVTGVRSHGDALYERFGALCESMEGAAAAHVCALHDIPFLEVRGISNLVEDRDRSSWRIEEAAEAAQAAALDLVAHAEYLLTTALR